MNKDSSKNLKCCRAPEQSKMCTRSGTETAKNIFKDKGFMDSNYGSTYKSSKMKRYASTLGWRIHFYFKFSVSLIHILWLLYSSANSWGENIVIARLQGKSSEKLWWHISKHAWYVLFSINTLGNVCTLFMSHIWNTFYGANEMFSWKIEVNLNWPFINKSKGDVRQQVLKRSFCLNYRFFPPGDNFNARSYSVGYNVIMDYPFAYIFKFFENCLFCM